MFVGFAFAIWDRWVRRVKRVNPGPVTIKSKTRPIRRVFYFKKNPSLLENLDTIKNRKRLVCGFCICKTGTLDPTREMSQPPARSQHGGKTYLQR